MSERNLATVPHVWVEGNVTWTNSLDVAAFFSKKHLHILRDIRALEINPNLDRSWFRERPYNDSYERSQSSIDMTKDGFTILAMGYTGPVAMEFKIRYIEAFNAMATAIQDGSGGIVSYDQLLGAIKETVAPLAVRFDSQDTAIYELAGNVERLSDDIGRLSDGQTQITNRMGALEAKITKGRRPINPRTKTEHVWSCFMLGGRCPGCGVNNVVNPDGTKSPFADFDHFYVNSQADASHTWLICKQSCHGPLSTGKIPRQDLERAFHAYQDKRSRLPGRQSGLFG